MRARTLTSASEMLNVIFQSLTQHTDAQVKHILCNLETYSFDENSKLIMGKKFCV